MRFYIIYFVVVVLVGENYGKAIMGTEILFLTHTHTHMQADKLNVVTILIPMTNAPTIITK